MREHIKLEFCKLSDPRYQEIRDRHYVDNRGCHGQQIHFMIHYKDTIVGIISGGSSVYAVKPRDDFFQIPKDKTKKQKYYLPAIINNTVFRLELHEKNLATCVLAKFRKTCQQLWKELYQVHPIGFETFVVEEDWRRGTLYKADNWRYLGQTAGSTKTHSGLKNKSQRVETCKKLVFAIKTGKKTPTEPYKSSWRLADPEEKRRANRLKQARNNLIGQMF